MTRAEMIAAELRQGDGQVVSTSRADPDVFDLLESVDPVHDWLVPDLLERGDRLIVTGPEGAGKSTLLRQLAVQVACGIHPLTGEPTVPARVLAIDLENSHRQVRRAMAPLVELAGDRLDREMLTPVIQPAGIDVLVPADAAWLRERVAANRPDLLIVGPLYKLAGGDSRDEPVARQVARLIDEMRVDYDITVVIEAHQPYAATGGNRPLRPYGASLWSRWPELGLHLAATGIVSHWRGARDERDWPAALTRGGEWPWSVQTSPVEVLWARIIEFAQSASSKPTERALGDALDVGKGSVHRAIEAHRDDWDALAERWS